MLWTWIVKIALWALAGFLATKLMKGSKGSAVANILLGLVGGLVGSLLFGLIGLKSTGGIIGDIVVSTVGASLCIWLVDKFNNK